MAKKKSKDMPKMDIDELKAYLNKEVKSVKVEIATERYENEGDVEPLATGNPWLDLITGIGGFPKGKIVEISGEEGVSKSALTQTIAGVIQYGGVIRPFRGDHDYDEMIEESGNVVFVDAERAIDLRIPTQRKHLAERLGVDIDRLLIAQPDTIEQGLDIVKACVASGNVSLVVYDSIVASATEDEFDKDNQEGSWNKLPQAINRGFRNLAPELSRTDCCLVVLNQLRQNMNKKNKFDKEWVTTGGKGLKHWCSLRIELTKAGKIKDTNGLEVGHRVRARIIKTRLDINHGDAYLYFYHDSGYNYGEELFELALEWEIIVSPSSGWYSFDIEEIDEKYDGKIRRSDMIDFLNEDEDLYNKVLEAVYYYFDEYNKGTALEDDLGEVDEDEEDDE